MKFRYVLLTLSGLVLAFGLFVFNSIARYQPRQYKFLGNSYPRKVNLITDHVGWPGMEVRYFVLHENLNDVTTQAQGELQGVGWQQLSSHPAIFGRGPHETIDVRSADQYNDAKLVGDIPPEQRSNFTVVKVVDPRMPPAISRRFARWTRHPFRKLLTRFA